MDEVLALAAAACRPRARLASAARAEPWRARQLATDLVEPVAGGLHVGARDLEVVARGGSSDRERDSAS